MLVNSKQMLEEAKAGHYAVPAANIVNLENIKGVIEAAEETPIDGVSGGGTYTDIRY